MQYHISLSKNNPRLVNRISINNSAVYGIISVYNEVNTSTVYNGSSFSNVQLSLIVSLGGVSSQWTLCVQPTSRGSLTQIFYS